MIDARKCSVWVWIYSYETNFEWGPNTLAKISYRMESDIKKLKKLKKSDHRGGQRQQRGED